MLAIRSVIKKNSIDKKRLKSLRGNETTIFRKPQEPYKNSRSLWFKKKYNCVKPNGENTRITVVRAYHTSAIYCCRVIQNVIKCSDTIIYSHNKNCN